MPVDVWRLRRVVLDVPFARRFDSAVVGRDHELALQAYELGAAHESCRLLTLLCPAGIGKSRLVRELVSVIGGRARVLAGRCLSYGEGITFWPLADIVRQAASLGRDVEPDEALRLLTELVAPSDEVACATELIRRRH